jgi:hypothetical protein
MPSQVENSPHETYRILRGTCFFFLPDRRYLIAATPFAAAQNKPASSH